MKVRSDFVTNSSSSSFVIAYKELPEIDKGILEKHPFLAMANKVIDFILHFEGYYGETSAAHIFHNKEEYVNYLIDYYSWGKPRKMLDKFLEENPELKERYDKVVKYIKDGYIVAEKSVGYADDGTQEILRLLAKNNDDFIIIEEKF